MSQPLSPYTSVDAVRSCIGITDNEILDEMLLDQQLGLELEVDLTQWLPTYSALYVTGMSAGAAAEDRLKASYLTLYAQWYLAAVVIYRMNLAIPQLLGDGKSEMRRFQDFDLEALQASVAGRAAHYKTLLVAATGGTASEVPSLIGRGIPSYDPVSNV